MLLLQPATLLRSLGNRGAVANVEALLAERRHQDRLVEALLRRIADRAPAPAATPADSRARRRPNAA